MDISYYDIKISEKILKKLNIKTLKFLSDLSDFILILYCLILVFISIKNILLLFFGWYISIFIQKIFNKKRPYVFFNLNINYNTPKDHSFPSSHTVLSILIFLKMLEINVLYSFIILIVPILRILSLQHWMSDIIISIILSVFIYLIFSFFNVYFY